MRPEEGHPDQTSGIRLVELADGPGRGVRLLEVRTSAGLTFEIAVDRGFDIGAASIRGRNLAYMGPPGHRAPWLSEADGMDSWLRRFTGGLLMTGGLDHVLGPDTDDASRFAYPGRREERFPLHGRAHAEPARLAGYGREGAVIWAEGVVTQAALYGEHLERRRRIECDDGGTAIRLTDRVVNLGPVPNPVMALYHVNLGWPLVEEGARILAPGTPRATTGFDVAGWDRVPDPVPGFAEEVVHLPAEGRAAVSNAAGDLMLAEAWDAGTLPHLFAWRQFAPRDYVLGLEPASHDRDRHAAREDGTLTVLEPGEAIDYRLTLTALEGADAAAALEDWT